MLIICLSSSISLLFDYLDLFRICYLVFKMFIGLSVHLQLVITIRVDSSIVYHLGDMSNLNLDKYKHIRCTLEECVIKFR